MSAASDGIVALMIPYDDLVAALHSWRARQGLPTGASEYLGEPAPADFAISASAAELDSSAVEDLGDDLVVEESPAWTTEPYDALAEDDSGDAAASYGDSDGPEFANADDESTMIGQSPLAQRGATPSPWSGEDEVEQPSSRWFDADEAADSEAAVTPAPAEPRRWFDSDEDSPPAESAAGSEEDDAIDVDAGGLEIEEAPAARQMPPMPPPGSARAGSAAELAPPPLAPPPDDEVEMLGGYASDDFADEPAADATVVGQSPTDPERS